ncbi:hypothetical protein ACIRQ6_18085 [Algirhabdus cladophorae]
MTATASFADFKPLSVQGSVELEESIDESSNTMSGNIKHRTTTSQLFSAFQLTSADEDQVIEVDKLKFAPILVPEKLPESAALFCVEVRTTNGFYFAFNNGNSLVEGTNDIASTMKTLTIEATDANRIDDQYTEKLMLMRGFLSQDCGARGSIYYVPMAISDAPKKFLAVFELGNASVKAELFGIDPQTENATGENLVEFDCKTTIRLSHGYDCTFDLDTLPKDAFSLYEVQLTVIRPQANDKKDIYRARVTIPPIADSP